MACMSNPPRSRTHRKSTASRDLVVFLELTMKPRMPRQAMTICILTRNQLGSVRLRSSVSHSYTEGGEQNAGLGCKKTGGMVGARGGQRLRGWVGGRESATSRSSRSIRSSTAMRT